MMTTLLACKMNSHTHTKQGAFSNKHTEQTQQTTVFLLLLSGDVSVFLLMFCLGEDDWDCVTQCSFRSLLMPVFLVYYSIETK